MENELRSVRRDSWKVFLKEMKNVMDAVMSVSIWYDLV